jgi:integrase
VPTVLVGTERVRRGGFPSRSAAEAARDELLARSAEDATAETWTVARWLAWWLSTRGSLRPSTLRSYTNHVQRRLIPYLGRIRLAELTGRDVAEMFTVLTEAPTRHGRPMTPASLHRIRATLRVALNAAIRDGLLRDNPARHVQLPTPRRPPELVWTKTRVQAWVDRGERSTVAVWTEHQLVAFLDFVAADRLYAMWWLIALRGLRRGEAAGLRWCDLDLEDRALTVNQQRLAYGTTVTVGPPKTAASRRTVALDRTTVTVLRAHRRRQEKERAAAGQAWQDTGYVFTTTDGQPLHPDFLTRRFRALVTNSGLPPVRLHDLRHGAASLAHSAGVDLKIVQEQVGHSSIVLTADTYTSVLTDKHHKAAEATARLVLAAAARGPKRRKRPAVGPPSKSAVDEATPRPEPVRPRRSRRRTKGNRRRTHITPTRHPRSTNDRAGR